VRTAARRTWLIMKVLVKALRSKDVDDVRESDSDEEDMHDD